MTHDNLNLLDKPAGVTGVGRSVLLGIVVGFKVWRLWDGLFFDNAQQSHQWKDSCAQSECDKTGRNLWPITTAAAGLSGAAIGLWLAGLVLGPLPIIGLVPPRLVMLSILLSILLTFLDSCDQIRSYKKRGLTMPNVESWPPPTHGVNRDSGTDRANGGWLRRLVRQFQSTILRLKNEQVRHGGMTLLILKSVKVLAVYPIAIRLVWFELHFHHTSLLVSIVFGLPD